MSTGGGAESVDVSQHILRMTSRNSVLLFLHRVHPVATQSTVIMEKSSKGQKPCTPVRKRFLDLFKPSIVLGKRDRNLSSDDAADTAHNAHSSRTRLKRSASIALQNEDEDLEETIIITALETVPFCCHEDLLTMTRPQLLAVVSALNTKLPGALRIDIKPSSTDSFIRNAIELIVGIKRTVPGAPKGVKLGLSSLADPDKSVSPPTSPLATKTRPRDVYLASPRLAALKEEDEEIILGLPERPIKKRKVSAQVDDPVRKKRRVSAQAALPAVRRIPTTSAHKPGLNRSRSQRVPSSQISPPRSSRILRSHSQKLPREMKDMKIDTTFVTMERPRYRFRAKTGGGITNTSTPAKGTYKDEMPFSQRDHDEDLHGETVQMAISTSTSNEGSPSSTSGGSAADRAIPSRNNVWATRGGEAAPGSGVHVNEDDDSDVTFGLHGMTLSVETRGSDMVF